MVVRVGRVVMVLRVGRVVDRRRNYVRHRNLAWSPSFSRETHTSHYRDDPVKSGLDHRSNIGPITPDDNSFDRER